MSTTDETREALIAEARAKVRDIFHGAYLQALQDDADDAELDAAVEVWRAALRSRRPEWEVKAEALEEVADHLSTPNILWHGDRGVVVYDSIEHSESGRKQPARIADWLRTRAAHLREQANPQESLTGSFCDRGPCAKTGGHSGDCEM